MPRERVFREDPDEESSLRSESSPRALGGGFASRDFDPDGRELDEELRPQRMEDVIGQRQVVDRLKIIIEATKKRNDILGHLLLDGPPGIGKTTLATVIPKELGGDIQMAAGPVLDAPKDLLPYLTNATEGSFLFIDEIHRLRPAVEEFLYPAMEDFRVDIALGEGLNARTINMPLKKFTVIGATTRAGMLTAPMRDRFVYREHLDFYEADDLVEIVTRNARKLRTAISPDAARELAKRSQGTPRKANNILRRTRDFATLNHPEGEITNEIAEYALKILEIDPLGLERQDRRYLKTVIEIFNGGPAGLNAIAHSMSIPPDTLEDDIEPYLLRSGLVQRTSRGRVITKNGYLHLGLEPGPDPMLGFRRPY